MKRLKRPIYAGISGKYNEEKGKYDFTVDFDKNTDDDIIKFIEPYFQRSEIDKNTYWFGYSFNDGQSNPRRDEFIEFIKHIQPERLVDPDDEWSGFDYDDDHLTETDLRTMVLRSLSRLHLDKYSVDVVVYPESKSGNLVQMITRCITDYLSSAVKRISAAELKKADPQSIEFDFDRFYRDLGSDQIDVPDYVDEEYLTRMLTKARNAESFSLRKYIKPTVLRNYVTNFYETGASLSAVEAAEVVLVVDDFGTTGTTIRELIRNVRQVNPTCEIYIFTLMGNRRRK